MGKIVLTALSFHELMQRLSDTVLQEKREVDAVILRNFIGMKAIPELYVYFGEAHRGYKNEPENVSTIIGEAGDVSIIDFYSNKDNAAAFIAAARFAKEKQIVKPLAFQYDIRCDRDDDKVHYIRLIV